MRVIKIILVSNLSIIVCETRKLSMAPTLIKRATVAGTRGRPCADLRAITHRVRATQVPIVFNAGISARNASYEMISVGADHTLP